MIHRFVPEHHPRLFRGFTALAACLCAAGIAGCGLKAPAKPQWSVTLRLPLAQKTLLISDLAAHNPSYLSVDSSGTASLSWSQDLSSGSVGNSLNLAPLTSDVSASLGTFTVNPAPPSAIQVRLSDIWPAAAGLSGTSSGVPALSFSPVESAQSTAFQSAQVQSGVLTVSVANHLPVGIAASTLVISNTGGGVVGTLHFGALADGESTSADLALDGKTLSSSWTGTWTGSSPGSVSPVMVDAEASVSAAFSFRAPLVVSAAVAPLPSQNIAWSSSAALPDTEQLTSADFSAGSLDLSFENHWGVGGALHVTLPDILTSGGTALTQSVQLDAARVVSLSVPLAGSHFTAADPAHPAIRLVGSLDAQGTGSRNLTISSSDQLAVHAAVNGASLSRVQGTFAPFRVTLATVQRSVQVPPGLGPLTLAGADARLTVSSTAGVAAHVVLGVTGTDAHGGQWALSPAAGSSLSLDIPAAAGNVPAMGALHLTRVNSNLPEFLGHLPTTLEVTAYADVGDRNQTSSVRAGDAFTSHLDVSSALLAVFSESRVTLDADSVRLSADLRDQIRNRLTRVVLHADVTNGLPLGADAAVFLGASREDVTTPGPSAVTLSAAAAAGQVDPVSGAVRAPSHGQVLVQLTGAQLDVLQSDPLFIGASVHLPGTGGRQVRVRGQDAVQARVWLEVEGKVIR